jgi:hypothetical protein
MGTLVDHPGQKTSHDMAGFMFANTSLHGNSGLFHDFQTMA